MEETWVLPIEHTRARVRVGPVFFARSFERKAIQNALTLAVRGVSTRYMSPGDLIMQRIIAGRPRDLEDARGVLRIQANRIDGKRVEKELSVLAAETDHSEWVERWGVFREFGRWAHTLPLNLSSLLIDLHHDPAERKSCNASSHDLSVL